MKKEFDYQGLAEKIFEKIYRTPTKREMKSVIEILTNCEKWNIANEICETLDIPKRGNRGEINSLITGR